MYKYSVGAEAIDFQSNTFGKELEAVFAAINDSKMTKKEIEFCEERKIIESIIKRHTGLNIDIIFDEKILGAVGISSIRKNHIFFTREFSAFNKTQDSRKFFHDAQSSKERNLVNLKEGYVTGIFSTFSVPIYLAAGAFFRKSMSNPLKQTKLVITPGQATAILLHEIGHLFTLYELMSRQQTTNQVLAAVVKSVTNKDTIKEREFILVEGALLAGLDKDSFETLKNQDDPRIITSVIFEKCDRICSSELGSGLYDFTGCEQVADQYVARQGYGREQLEALDELHMFMGSIEKDKNASYILSFSSITFFGVLTAMAVLSAALGVVGAAAFYGVWAAIFLNSRSSANKSWEYTRYDILKTRYLRLKEQIVVKLKDPNLKKEEIKLALDDIEKMDKIIASTYEAKDAMTILANFFNSTGRKHADVVELQRNLEQLAMNDFFVKSAQLKTI